MSLAPSFRVAKWLRHRAGWLLAIALLLLWPRAQQLLVDFQQLYTGDEQTALATSPWLPLGNPLSKLLLTMAVAALGYGFMWLGMRLFHTCMHAWAKTDYKRAFDALSDKWKIVLFCGFWLGLLFYFALIWLGASLVA
ncbi:hypothetical protein LJ737_04175 [Hymenobacter sp. 15J16-1T3B]|uniref:hypothetical protein n=1 Tax=Hymenobacter sp. 15J16-1T3B TaxID=2886941 RepID=UPI001D109B8F|nr:hypothetical protein [Hymenobacter sp. 15J16-1T3B]MCC3156419.1 hypothetical protein [Hymenobacter sp. 15J16-1T3B]